MVDEEKANYFYKKGRRNARTTMYRFENHQLSEQYQCKGELKQIEMTRAQKKNAMDKRNMQNKSAKKMRICNVSQMYL